MPFEELERQLKHFWWEDEPELGRRFFSDFCDKKTSGKTDQKFDSKRFSYDNFGYLQNSKAICKNDKLVNFTLNFVACRLTTSHSMIFVKMNDYNIFE